MRCIFLYSEKHEVVTRWGRFLLDDGAYAAYLEGKLWISWGSSRPTPKPRIPPPVPVQVSEEALRLREAASRQDLFLFLQQHFPGRRIPVPYRERMEDRPIDELNLSFRASNALMRANARTLGRVWEILQMEDGLKKIRSLGIKSEREIRRSFFSGCYAGLTLPEQAVFWQTVLDREKDRLPESEAR